MGHVLILGAASDIAKALSREYASRKFNLYLGGRDVEELQKEASDLSIRFGVEAKAVHFDALDFGKHEDFFDSLLPKPAGVIWVVGYMGNQPPGEGDFKEARLVLDTNFTAAVSILNIAARHFANSKSGFIIGISSVAGDRGRASNYLYGSAKAGLTAYLSGLRNRFFADGVQVLTVKPGFVRTKMTKGLNLPPALVASPEGIAKEIARSHLRGKNVIYTPWWWRYIMLLIKAIPEPIFRKMSL